MCPRSGSFFQELRSLQVSLAGARYTRSGVVLSHKDSWRVAYTFTLWAMMAYDAGVDTELARCFSTANITRWLCQLRVIDLDLTFNALKTALGVLRHSASRVRPSIKRYKLAWRSAVSGTRIDFLTPMFYRWLRSGEPEDYKVINDLLQFPTRLTLRDDKSLEADAINEYMLFEQNLLNQVYPQSLVDELRNSFNDLFGGITDSDIKPRFSAGATAEVRRGKGKYLKMQAPLTWGVYQEMLRLNVPMFDTFSMPTPKANTSKVQLVPKGIDKKRTIAMEPSCQNYIQEGLFQVFDEWYLTHPQTRVHLHDQGRNRILALKGSKDRSYSTIDLSNASDSVTLSLVKQVMQDSALLPHLIRTRSACADLSTYGRGVIRLEKFASMGSAITFPLECAIFTSCVHIVEMRRGKPFTYAVYGDDIVVPTEFAEDVIDILSQLHFQVNETKSFVGTLFTESCGIEAYHGFDVTPLRISRRFDPVEGLTLRQHPEQYSGAIDLVNRLYGTRYIMTRKFLLKDLLRQIPETLFSFSDEVGVRTHAASPNQHLKTRYNSALQRLEVRCAMPVTKTSNGPDDFRYQVVLEHYHWTERQTLDENTLIQERTGASSMRLINVWYPIDAPGKG